MPMYTHRVTVEGSFQFPVDMLRYDYCFPDSEADSAAIANEEHSREPRRVRVVQVTDSKRPMFTPARWESFGWKILPDREATRETSSFRAPPVHRCGPLCPEHGDRRDTSIDRTPIDAIKASIPAGQASPL